MSERWKLGQYQFVINPNQYSEQIQVIGDNVRTLDGTLVSQPTTTSEDYRLSSVFFQHRPRVVSEVSLSKAETLAFAGEKIYAVDKDTQFLKVYNRGLGAPIRTIEIFDGASNYKALAVDVEEDETIWAVDDNTPNSSIHKSANSTRIAYSTSGLTGTIVGIKSLGGYIWVVTDQSVLYKLSKTNLSVLDSVNLPFISFSQSGYAGLSAVDGFLVVSYADGEHAGVHFVDISNGAICNSFRLPEHKEVKDVSFDGKHYMFLLKTSETIQYTTGNTVLLDVYKLEKEIREKGFLSMIDDMGVSKRVSIVDYSITRQLGATSRYDVSISTTKVNRGVN